jgi:hypothetical protein
VIPSILSASANVQSQSLVIAYCGLHRYKAYEVHLSSCFYF